MITYYYFINIKTLNYSLDKSIQASTVLDSTSEFEVLVAFTKRTAIDDV